MTRVIDNIFKRALLLILLLGAVSLYSYAQELTFKVNVNHNQVQGTDVSVFERFKEVVEEFINNRQWTSLQFQEKERIQCSLNLTVKKYDAEKNLWTCNALIQANRPVFNSSYNTEFYKNTDNDFVFTFNQFDQLEFNEDMIDNQLTALIAYYAYLIIGWDLDTFSPRGGEDVLQRCLNLANNAQNLEFPGWKAFENDRNRYAIINDYMDPAMAPFRQFQYDYYRKGLDEMATNVERGRTEISTSIEEQFNKSHKDRPMSMLPQIWTDYKRDEIANIYKGKGTQKEKETVYDILFAINPSQSNAWDKIKQ